jgi:hypothetical protein
MTARLERDRTRIRTSRLAASGGVDTNVYRYEAYGLTLASDSLLPELLPSRGSQAVAEVRVNLDNPSGEFRPMTNWMVTTASSEGTPWLFWARVSDGYLLRFQDLADFLIHPDGCRIDCLAAANGVSATTLRHLLIDHVLPRALNRIGLDALHATAVIFDRRVCAFVAEAGTGKSTLAASFLLAGYPTFADDCLVLRDTRPPIAMPAYPGVRLWEESFKALRDSIGRRGTPVAQYTAKTRQLGDIEGFSAEPLPLSRIYLLARHAAHDSGGQALAPRLDPLKPGEAFAALMAATFPLDITDNAMLARHFRLLSHVAAEIPIRRLAFPTDFGALPAVHSLILDDQAAA